MALKEELVEALRTEGIADLLEITIPEMPDLPVPVSDDMVANSYTLAAYADNCNKFLKVFAGVRLFDFLLRGMQRSPGLISLVMASLENRPSANSIQVISPQEGSAWVGFVPMSIVASSSEITSVSVGGTPGGEIWIAVYGSQGNQKLPLPAGSYALSFAGEDSTDTVITETVAVSVDVANYTTYPPDNGVQIPNEISLEVYTGASTAEISEGTCTVDSEEPFSLVPGTGKWSSAETYEYSSGNHTVHWRLFVALGFWVEWDSSFDIPII